AMSLSPEEYREHLATTAVRAGFSFSDVQVVLPQSREFHLGRMRFHYLDWGNRHLPTIVFLHGGALNAHTWDLCCLALRDEYHCVALDQRGHGDTDWAHDGDYSIGAALTDTTGFVDHLGLDKFILAGMSLGAINSLAFAVAHPERLSHLVIIDAGPEIRRPGSSRIRDFVREVQETVTVEAIIEKALEFNPRRDPKILRRSLMHNLRQQPDGTWRWKYDTRRFKALDQEKHRADRAKLADGLARITCPALVVRGGESDVFHEEDGIRLAERLPKGKFVTVPRAGHTVQGDNPKDLVVELRRFLAGDN
ncbi:MAG: alpha/beta hydrolase, partial [Alphaproteobacteria bacterium]|nr:alpha/beta hydrolase [Alphaproteobacteria bacterium]